MVVTTHQTWEYLAAYEHELSDIEARELQQRFELAERPIRAACVLRPSAMHREDSEVVKVTVEEDMDPNESLETVLGAVSAGGWELVCTVHDYSVFHGEFAFVFKRPLEAC